MVNRVNADTQKKLGRHTWLGFAITAEVFLCYADDGFTITLYADKCADRIEVCLKANGNAPMQRVVMLCHAKVLSSQSV